MKKILKISSMILGTSLIVATPIFMSASCSSSPTRAIDNLNDNLIVELERLVKLLQEIFKSLKNTKELNHG